MNIQELFDKIENEMKLRNFSRKTVRAYLGCLGDYFIYIKTVKGNEDCITIFWMSSDL
jgi:hypothetical protein